MIGLLYDLLYMLPLCFISMLSAGDILKLPGVGIGISLITIIFAVLISLLFHSKNKLKYLFAGIFVLFIIVVVLAQGTQRRAAFIDKYIWLVTLLAMILICEIVGTLCGRYPGIRRGIGMVLLVAAAVITVRHIDIHKAVVALAFLELMVFVADEIQLMWKKSGDTEHKAHIVYVAPFLLIVALVVFKLPAASKPYDWKLAVTVWERTVEAVKGLSKYFPGKDMFDYSKSGFSDSAGFSGEIYNAPEDILEVSFADNYIKTAYLAGIYLDTFNGKEWTATKKSTEKYRIMDTIESQCAVRMYDLDNYSDYIKTTKLNIRYLMFTTKYLFTPTKLIYDTNEIGSVKFDEYQDALYGDKKLGYGSNLNVRFIRLNTDKSKFTDLINGRKVITEDAWTRVVSNYNKELLKDLSYENYLKYREDTIKTYSEKIEISDELRKTLDEVYDGAVSKWDKIKALEAWLNTFTYTESPGPLPKDIQNASQYLDYFLLESKQGYCTHFATALTLLARAEGIPARFVQGFYVRRNSNTQIVTSDMTHAWVEVYLADFGWVSLEPTPTYKVDNSWMVHEDYTGRETVKRNENYVEEEPETDSEEASDADDLSRVPTGLIIVIVALCFLFTIIFIVSSWLIIRNKVNRISKDNLCIVYCRINMKVLEYLGYKRETDETLTEYRGRIRSEFETNQSAIAFIDAYERLLYSNSYDIDELSLCIETSRCKLRELLAETKKIVNTVYLVRLSVRFSTIVTDYS